MTGLDDSTLVAYVDDELDAEQARAVETALAGDPEARSRVQVFRETAALVRAQILQQAGIAILAQANALPQTALALLQ